MRGSSAGRPKEQDALAGAQQGPPLEEAGSRQRQQDNLNRGGGVNMR